MEIRTKNQNGNKAEAQTLQRLWDEGKQRLEKAGVAEYELDAKYLLLEAFQIDMAHFLILRGNKLDMADETVRLKAEKYREWIARRANRIPLQYLLGKQEFMGLEFAVNENVLIPRQDTETLVELVMKRRPAGEETRILDMCTGSGCIAVSLMVLGNYRNVTAADISCKALETAYGNAKSCLEKAGIKISRESESPWKAETPWKTEIPWKAEILWEKPEEEGKNTGKIQMVYSDLFQNLDKSAKYDIIVSNPPYIASKVIEGLEPEVRDYEPRLALDGTEDGLYFYRRLAAESGGYLSEGGEIFLEIGFDQGAAVKALLEENGFGHIEIIKDGAGLDRVAHGRR